MVEEARAFARAEVESAHSTVLRVEAALEEQAQTLKIAEKEVSDIRLTLYWNLFEKPYELQV